MTAIDKAKVACCFGKSVESYEQHAHVQKEIAAHLAGLAGDYVKPLPAKVLEVGCGTGLLTGSIKRLWTGCDLWINDLVEGLYKEINDNEEFIYFILDNYQLQKCLF